MKAGADVQVLVQHPLVRTVQTLAKKQGGTAYLVGGAVRDWLRTGQVPLDLDFTLIDCHAADLAKTLADERQGHLVPLDWEFGIYRVVFDDGMMVDLADALENDLQIDLARRDLTVNAIALDLETGSRIDPFKGQADLAAGVIRMVSEANLREDPLRLLRVFRFAALIQAQSIDPATLAVVEGHAGQVWEAAGERIQYEFFRFLSLDGCFPYLQMMADCGLLETLLPDLTPMRKIAGSGFHHLGLFEHTLELVKQAERLLPDLPTAVRDWLKQSMGGSYTRFGMVKLACLLHDIGKPDTMGEREDPVHGKRLTFYGHEELGAEMAKPLLQRLKVSNEIRDYQVKLIRWHLYPCQFGPGSPRKSVLKFYRRMGEETIDVTVLALADRHSATGAWITPEGIAEAHQAHLWLLENYQAEQPALQLPKLLNGHEVMSTLGVGPGPHLKEIMDALVEAQQLGEIKTPDEARSWLKAEFASSTS